MLSTFELITCSVLAASTPFILWSLFNGTPAQFGPLARFHAKESLLLPVGNIFVLVLCVGAILRLGGHFGYVTAGRVTAIDLYLSVAFAILFLAYATLWVRAVRRVRREAA